MGLKYTPNPPGYRQLALPAGRQGSKGRGHDSYRDCRLSYLFKQKCHF